MTYGALVAQVRRSLWTCNPHPCPSVQVVDDCGDAEAANATLEQLGAEIGSRIADDYLSKASNARCRTFRETMTAIASVSL
jgi:hypothetical protein